MKKQLPLYLLLLFLIAVNTFFLFNYLGGSKDNFAGESRGQDSFIERELDFNTEQRSAFNKKESDHRFNMKALDQQIRKGKEMLFDLISQEYVEPSELDSITSSIAEFEKSKDLEIYRHFRSIFDICNEQQRRRLSIILKDAMHHRRPRGPHGPPPGQGPPRGDRPPDKDRPHRP